MNRLFLILLFITPFIGYTQLEIYDGLIAYYPLDGNANDYSDSLNHGTINGASSATGITGEPNSCYDFTNGTIDIANGMILPDSILTLSVWVYLNNNDNFYNGFFALNIGNDNYPSVDFWINPGVTTTLACSLETRDNYYHVEEQLSDFKLNQWHHILFEYDSKTRSIFLDGNLTSTDNAANAYSESTANYSKGMIGNRFNGRIDELMIFNKKLTQTEKESLNKKDYILSVASNKQQIDSPIYPNPTNNTLNINKKKKELVNILNLNGELLYTGFNSKIDLSKIPSGLYFLQLNKDGVSENHTFIKQ